MGQVIADFQEGLDFSSFEHPSDDNQEGTWISVQQP